MLLPDGKFNNIYDSILQTRTTINFRNSRSGYTLPESRALSAEIFDFRTTILEIGNVKDSAKMIWYINKHSIILFHYRFIVCSILWWWLFTYPHTTICVLWCCIETASWFPRTPYETTLWTTIAIQWTAGASNIVAYYIPAGNSTRCARTFFRWTRMRLMIYWVFP